MFNQFYDKMKNNLEKNDGLLIDRLNDISRLIFSPNVDISMRDKEGLLAREILESAKIG